MNNLSSDIIRLQIRTWLLFSMAFILPFKFKMISILLTLYFFVWVWEGRWKTCWKDILGNKVALLMMSFYGLHLAGMLWTDNIDDGVFDLQVKFSFLLIPLLMSDPAFFNRDRINGAIRFFVYGCLCAITIDLLYAFITDNQHRFYYSTLSRFLHPGYFSLYLCFSAAVILYDLIRNVNDRLFNRTFSVIAFVLFSIGIILLASKAGLLTLVLLVVSFFLLNVRSFKNNYTNISLAVFAILAMGLAYQIPFIHDRIHELSSLFGSGHSGVSSSSMRLQVWNAALEIIRNNPLAGTGTGDIKDRLIELYYQHGYNYVAEVRLNAHNQFLQSFAALGVMGFLLFSGLFVFGFVHAKRSKNTLLTWFLVILAVYSLVESVLEVQAGVMFFALFLPLLVQWRAEPVSENVSAPLSPADVLQAIQSYAQLHPLRFALITGFLVRLVAVVFSKGFGMHDDHFLVIEASGAWVDGTDYDGWLPSHGGVKPDGHSFFYSGMHFIFFHLLKFIGIDDPQLKMVFVRLVHAILSLGTIYFGFRITYRISNLKSATAVGLLLALMWFMPWLSVRNLVEVACIPFLIWGSWLMLAADEKPRPLKYFFYAGMILGVAFSIRFQTVLFIGGAGLALFFLKRFREAFVLGAGTLAVFFTTQAPVDYLIWGAPFAQFAEYIRYNLENAYNYIVGPWYNYTLLILGILIPPVSFFLFFGWLRQWRKQLLLFLPVFVFLAFHSYFPNKQERFILPVVPFFVILGIPGWNAWLESKDRSKLFLKIVRSSWVFFWVINTLLLPFISTMYSKRARVESMSYLYPKRATISSIIMEDTNRSSAKMAPEFYLGKWIITYKLSQESGYDSLEFYLNKYGPADYPQYALFLGDKRLEERVANLRKYFPDMVLETTIEPGFVDKVLYWLNPRNANDVIYVYRTGIPPLRPPD